MTDKLKPCPFCGGNVKVAKMGDNGHMWWFITRGSGENKCRCRVFMESEDFCINDTMEFKQKLKEELINAWNRRADNDR